VSLSARTSSAAAILNLLEQTYPDAHCELEFSCPLELLMATILSAQCTDVRVNQVTRVLFKRCRTARDYAEIPQEELEQIVKPTGFYRAKARHLKGCARELVSHHGGEVPASLESLTALPGVGRKTANVVLGDAFQNPAGVVVDTHVQRLSKRLGFSKNAAPEKIEQDLMRLVPRPLWARLSHWLIWHGRRRCTARKPDCDHCELRTLCPSATQDASRIGRKPPKNKVSRPKKGGPRASKHKQVPTPAKRASKKRQTAS
jgi:endonuclease-3